MTSDGGRVRQVAGARTIEVHSITHLDAGSAGAVVVAASHGGRYSARVAVDRAARAVVLHDAGVGMDAAGIAGLEVLQRHLVPAAAVGSASALIGNVDSMVKHGRIGHVNAAARELGCEIGMPVPAAVALLASAEQRLRVPPCPAASTRAARAVGTTEARILLGRGPVKVWALDSASLVTAGDRGAVVITGSHGQLLGGSPASALNVRPAAAVFNDAGVPSGGPSGRLGVLEGLGVPAATVAVASARIGEGGSTYFDGVLSRVNGPAARAGCAVGMCTPEFVALVVRHAAAGRGPHHTDGSEGESSGHHAINSDAGSGRRTSA